MGACMGSEQHAWGMGACMGSEQHACRMRACMGSEQHDAWGMGACMGSEQHDAWAQAAGTLFDGVIKDENAEDIFLACDLNGDGVIDFQEFVAASIRTQQVR